MNSEVVFDNIISSIESAKRVLILTHESPDGDAVGSSLGMYIALRGLKKDVDVVIDEYSWVFNFLPYIDEVKREASGEYDLVIVLDCATRKRLYDPSGIVDKSRLVISIDHHASNNYFADYNYVEGNSPAASQVIIKVLKRLGVSLTKEICECLIAGIITDTGGFRFSTVNDETFEFAAKILDLGVNISDIYIRVFQTKSKAQFRLGQIANSRLELLYKDKIAFTYITLADEKKCKALKGDHEGIVNVGQSIEGVEVSVFLHECDKGFKVSLRSNNSIDVARIAELFGGGGHVNASGCLIEDSLDNVKNMVIKEVKRAL